MFVDIWANAVSPYLTATGEFSPQECSSHSQESESSTPVRSSSVTLTSSSRKRSSVPLSPPSLIPASKKAREELNEQSMDTESCGLKSEDTMDKEIQQHFLGMLLHGAQWVGVENRSGCLLFTFCNLFQLADRECPVGANYVVKMDQSVCLGVLSQLLCYLIM